MAQTVDDACYSVGGHNTTRIDEEKATYDSGGEKSLACDPGS